MSSLCSRCGIFLEKLSNLFFHRAKEQKYPSSDVYRKLAYNYYILEEYKNLLNTLDELLQREDIEIQDYTNAIYVALDLDADGTLVSKWIKNASDAYPQSSEIIGLGGLTLEKE